MIKKRGRPPKEKSRNCCYKIRMTEDEMAVLDNISRKTGKNKSDILREGLQMQHNLFKFR